MEILEPQYHIQASGTKSLLRDSTIAVLAACLTLFLFELGMNLAGVHHAGSFFTRDAKRGYAFRRGAQGWWLLESRSYVRMNSHGYHDYEHPSVKPAGVIRIAVVGSSFVAANDVPLSKNFISVLEQSLNRTANPQHRVEALNFGVNAYCPVQSYYTVQQDVWPSHPDIVVFCISNIDILDTCRRVAYNKQFKDRPFFEVDGHGNVVPDRLSRLMSPPDPAQVEAEERRKNLINRSELALASNEAFDKASSRFETKAPEPADRDHPVISYPHALTFLPPPRNGPMEQAWGVLEALVPKLKLEAAQHSAELWLLPIGMPEQDSPDPHVAEEFKKRIGADDLDYWDKRVTAIAQANGIHCLDLPPLMAAEASRSHAYLHGTFYTPLGQGHWNVIGNDLAGHLIADAIKKSSRVFAPIQ